MDWPTLLAHAVLLTIAAGVLFALWNWLLFLVMWGGAAYTGIVAGWYAAAAFDSGLVGVSIALLVTGGLANLFSRVSQRLMGAR
ncbi:MAG: hypothetical protein WDN76_04635 [Alphaproteobacteria bacterium]